MTPTGNEDFEQWMLEVMSQRPFGNAYVDSPRGIEVGKLCIDFERENFSWRRGDPDTFWIDVQMFVKYKLTDEEIVFTLKMQPGADCYRKHSEERNAFSEFMRGLTKLRRINTKKENQQKQPL